MDYGSANDNGGQMGLSAQQAATNTHNQVVAAGLSASIGVTPMIGINDVNTEIFQLTDAQSLLNFANANSYITRIAMWSVARDNGGCAGQGFASPTCSGISQSNWAFANIFKPFHWLVVSPGELFGFKPHPAYKRSAYSEQREVDFRQIGEYDVEPRLASSTCSGTTLFKLL